jgi:pimeloyl-ACP methyl ester carboxylesterase
MIEGSFQKAPSPDKNSFESQYSHKESFVINGAQVNTVDIKPENQKEEVPVLIAPGWGATMESFKPGLKVLSEKGRRVVSLDQPRKGGTIPQSQNEEIEKWYKEKGQKYPDFPSEELRKAQTILGLLEQKNLEKADVIAHSEGAINVCIAAMLEPEKFKGRTIILYSPAGVIGKDNIFRLQKGAAATTSRTETVSDIPVTEKETEYLESTKHITPDYLKANPLRALKETWAISRANIEEMLRYIRSKGIKVILVGAVDDTMFPMDKMQQNVKSDFVDGFVSVKGGHMQIQVHPEIFMSAIETMLPKAEQKSK